MNPQTSANLGNADRPPSVAKIAESPLDRTGAPGLAPGLARELTWTVHPARRNPVQAIAVAGVVLLIPLALHLIFGDPFLVFLSVLILGVSLGGYFFPTTVRFTESGVEVKSAWGRKSRPWSSFRSFQCDAEHLRLCPLSRPSRLDNYRGILLRFQGNRDEVLRYIRRCIPAPATSGEGGTRRT